MSKYIIKRTRYGTIRLAYMCMDCGAVIDPDEETCFYDEETEELRCALCFQKWMKYYEQDCKSAVEELPESALSEVYDDTDV